MDKQYPIINNILNRLDNCKILNYALTNKSNYGITEKYISNKYNIFNCLFNEHLSRKYTFCQSCGEKKIYGNKINFCDKCHEIICKSCIGHICPVSKKCICQCCIPYDPKMKMGLCSCKNSWCKDCVKSNKHLCDCNEDKCIKCSIYNCSICDKKICKKCNEYQCDRCKKQSLCYECTHGCGTCDTTLCKSCQTIKCDKCNWPFCNEQCLGDHECEG